MKGTWSGTYTYLNKRLSEELHKRETKFKIIIDQFDGVNFSGWVEDDIESGGMKGNGTIEGTLIKDKIKFIKMMPTQTVYLPDGSKHNENKPHRKIYYTGVKINNSIKGQWKFKIGFGRVNNRLALFLASRGLWEMKK